MLNKGCATCNANLFLSIQFTILFIMSAVWHGWSWKNGFPRIGCSWNEITESQIENLGIFLPQGTHVLPVIICRYILSLPCVYENKRCVKWAHCFIASLWGLGCSCIGLVRLCKGSEIKVYTIYRPSSALFIHSLAIGFFFCFFY
jgi:hypothetical protein